MKVGLRIDADTYRGTQYGVPRLLRLFERYGITGTFFFSVGPDNMGRHFWRLIRPSFFWKMVRSKGPALYGWTILLKGTLWPGPVIGKKFAGIIRSVAEVGHEVGLHAWDHHAWQTHIDIMSAADISHSLQKGFNALSQILGHPPECSAVPGWRCNNFTLQEKAHFPFKYNSDCRGETLFYPMVHGQVLAQPQIPVTLPTFDEVIGTMGISIKNYNDYMLSRIKPMSLNVLTVHAEVEGMAYLEMFKRFLEKAGSQAIAFFPLGTFITEQGSIDRGTMVQQTIPGREGWVSCQRTLE
jgi:undecaprenyl phosphate-alpha-L-ara4FN deformylase